MTLAVGVSLLDVDFVVFSSCPRSFSFVTVCVSPSTVVEALPLERDGVLEDDADALTLPLPCARLVLVTEPSSTSTFCSRLESPPVELERCVRVVVPSSPVVDVDVLTTIEVKPTPFPVDAVALPDAELPPEWCLWSDSPSTAMQRATTRRTANLTGRCMV